ncbi:hypothetical protein I3W98_33160, partial [Streptomyces cavourensis]|nr:hypothetical protein [Streptomyces cavourensis]
MISVLVSPSRLPTVTVRAQLDDPQLVSSESATRPGGSAGTASFGGTFASPASRNATSEPTTVSPTYAPSTPTDLLRRRSHSSDAGPRRARSHRTPHQMTSGAVTPKRRWASARGMPVTHPCCTETRRAPATARTAPTAVPLRVGQRAGGRAGDGDADGHPG